MGEAAAVEGLSVALHINMMTGSRLDRPEDVEEFFAEVGRDNVGLMFCFGCIALAGLDVPDTIRRWRELIFVVDLRDVRGTWGANSEEAQFGTGNIDLAASLRALQEIGYEGVVRPEHFPPLGPGRTAEETLAWTLDIAGHCWILCRGDFHEQTQRSESDGLGGWPVGLRTAGVSAAGGRHLLVLSPRAAGEIVCCKGPLRREPQLELARIADGRGGLDPQAPRDDPGSHRQHSSHAGQRDLAEGGGARRTGARDYRVPGRSGRGAVTLGVPQRPAAVVAAGRLRRGGLARRLAAHLRAVPELCGQGNGRPASGREARCDAGTSEARVLVAQPGTAQDARRASTTCG